MPLSLGLLIPSQGLHIHLKNLQFFFFSFFLFSFEEYCTINTFVGEADLKGHIYILDFKSYATVTMKCSRQRVTLSSTL